MNVNKESEVQSSYLVKEKKKSTIVFTVCLFWLVAVK
jgi:hypothetical protein